MRSYTPNFGSSGLHVTAAGRKKAYEPCILALRIVRVVYALIFSNWLIQTVAGIASWMLGTGDLANAISMLTVLLTGAIWMGVFGSLFLWIRGFINRLHQKASFAPRKLLPRVWSV